MKGSEHLHLTYSELINGYSVHLDDNVELYIKHPSHLDSLKIEKQYLHFLTKARAQSLPSNADREKQILLEGWTEQEQDELDNTITFIRGLNDNISHEYRYSKRQIWKREILDAEKRLDGLLIKKDYLVGSTAEKYANQQSFHYQVINSFYKDEKLSQKIEIDDTSSEEYDKLVGIYHDYRNRMDNDNIKKIAVSPFFTNIFHMASDNAYYFYGRPIVSLTSYQTNLFNWGRYFKSLMGQYGDRLPKSMTEDIDDMVEFFEITQNAEKSGILKEEEADGGMSSIVGATKKDMEMLGIDTSRVVNLSKVMNKKGKTMLDKNDLFEMSG